MDTSTEPVDSNTNYEYEYEYETTETKSFFVDLDLSSLNGVVKSRNQGVRKSLKAGGRAQGTLDPKNLGIGADEPDAHTARRTQAFDRGQETNRRDIQILDFHTHNPIISYRDQVYSCTWTDMIGTNMFFTQPGEISTHDSPSSTENYDMLGVSRIKLVGHRAKVLPVAQSKKRRRTEEIGSEIGFADEVNGVDCVESEKEEPLLRPASKLSLELQKQSLFLQKLKEVKRVRRETDD